MRLLLDAHVFLWWVSDSPRLSPAAREHCRHAGNQLFLSSASIWEIAIKARIGKLTIPAPLDVFLTEQLNINAIESLPVTLQHALRVAELPDHHRDPFDRMLVAQALTESLPILTSDTAIRAYGVEVVW